MNHMNDNVLVTAQLEDIQVLDHIDDILSVDGIDLFASGAQDIAQSMGLPGQPTHPDVLEFENKIRDLVHQAGKKMADEVMPSIGAVSILLEGSLAYLKSAKGDA
jgi:4-hydroxy-2-oxoheptanedioate aldolase